MHLFVHASCSLTLLKSTGGFFPRHKFDKHQTALRTMVNRALRVKILRTKYTDDESMEKMLTSVMVEEHLNREHNHGIRDCLQRCYQEPKPPSKIHCKRSMKKSVTFTCSCTSSFVLINSWTNTGTAPASITYFV